MHSTTIVIVFLSVGSVVMDSIIKELCTNSYFDSYVVSYSTGPIDLQLSRKLDSNEMKYHSWDLKIEYQSKRFKTKPNEIQYIPKVGQTPNSSKLVQPRVCGIDIAHRLTIGKTNGKPNSYDWVLNGLKVINLVTGPNVVYNHKYIYSYNKGSGGRAVWEQTEVVIRNQRSPLLVPTVKGSVFSIRGLLCATKVSKDSEPNIYLIAEKANSMNDSNRTQFVGRLRIDKTANDTSIVNPNTYPANKYDTKLTFSLELMNQTVIEFLGIDCQNITTITSSTTIPTDSGNGFWNWFPSTKTLKKIFWSLVISGAILSVIDLLLVIKRKHPVFQNTTDINTQTTSTSTAETGTSRLVSKNSKLNKVVSETPTH